MSRHMSLDDYQALPLRERRQVFRAAMKYREATMPSLVPGNDDDDA